MNVPRQRPEHHSFSYVIFSFRRWWRNAVVDTVDQADVIERRREEGDLSARYLFMLTMSAGIAILGLLLSSPAVVIGAMLLSPLMGPIIGLGFSLAIGDFPWMRRCAKALLVGTLLSVAFCALVVLFSPLQTVTAEIAARTRPNLFDLLVALFSALAGAYAMIRGREGTVVGVAIATALMPPLAVVGFGLATFNWTVFSGALLLYVTNLMTIAFTAAVMARLYGFRTTLSERQTQLQVFAIVVTFVALALPLGYSLRQIAWESNVSRQAQSAVMDNFSGKARLSQMDIRFDASPIDVSATVLTPELMPDAETISRRELRRLLNNRSLNFTLTQYQVGTSATAAEQAQLAAAREAAEADASQRAEELAQRLSLIAGVPESEVLVDRERRRALVRAQELEGAGLASYRELERRIGGTEPEWRVELLPPAKALPSIALNAEGKLTDDGEKALALVEWAAGRIDVPVIIDGPQSDRETVEKLLSVRNVAVRDGEERKGAVQVRWANPAD
ncbi:DUF389 domain-containing protein [Altericroceibacterium spongiae]|uniref:DUF389 domain-containing protein n=1 Tax=Altericroceibacterium spongiae TaxID=2320269 RepID=A0A420EIS4_9SPHN|nr:DUF389 domain-containing protein [Altericroceibacterium spongiae]RKF20621.1 DUF389 domain-containing protein [Altericroceibacterium spongiae]